jgi:hypothetical protein
VDLKDEIKIRSVSHFIEEINRNHFDKNVYRGVSSDRYKLIPSIARFPHLNKCPDFRWDTFRSDLEQKFINEYESFSKKDFKHELEMWAVAQHHGLITHLLDWTQNPLVALYFSVSKIKHYEKDDENDSIVWALSNFESFYPDSGSELPSVDKEVVVFPRFLSERFKSQRGCFTVHKIPSMNADFTPMEESQSASKLKKYIIPKTEKKAIRIQLNTIGFNEGTIFPDLDGMCRQLTWKATNTNYTQYVVL